MNDPEKQFLEAEPRIQARVKKLALAWSVFDQIFYGVLGQILIPVPVLGFFLGWLASGILPRPGDALGAWQVHRLLKREIRLAHGVPREFS